MAQILAAAGLGAVQQAAQSLLRPILLWTPCWSKRWFTAVRDQQSCVFGNLILQLGSQK